MWDFDRVLFDTARFIRDSERIFVAHHIPPVLVRATREEIRVSGAPYSLARLFRMLRHENIIFSEKKVRRAIHTSLMRCTYLDPHADRMLHRLKKKGYIHIIVSFGSPPHQYKKIATGCGEVFMRHLTKIFITQKPKYLILKRIARVFPARKIFFVDDTKEHLTLAKKYTPQVVTIHYTNLLSLPKVEQNIITHLG